MLDNNIFMMMEGNANSQAASGSGNSYPVETGKLLAKWRMHKPGDSKILRLGVPGNLSHVCTKRTV